MILLANLLLALESLVYSHTGGETLTQAATPKGSGPHPVLLLLDAPVLAAPAAASGYAAFTITHRAAYPESLEDVQRALRFLRANARRWNLDPRRIAIVGYSREGVLSTLAGLEGARRAAAMSDPADRESAAVQAVVTIAGPSDFRQPRFAHTEPEDASPVMHIGRGLAPPFLLIHGDDDDQIPITQSTHLQNTLQTAGVKCNLIIIGGGGHRIADWPPARNWMGEMFAWLRQVMR